MPNGTIGPIQNPGLLAKALRGYGDFLNWSGGKVNQLGGYLGSNQNSPKAQLFAIALRNSGQGLQSSGEALHDWGLGFSPIRSTPSGGWINPVVDRKQLVDAANGLMLGYNVAKEIPGAITDAGRDFMNASVAGLPHMAPKALDEADSLIPKSAQMAWDLGTKHRQLMDTNGWSKLDMIDNVPRRELEMVASMEESDPVSRAFYESALRNAEQPKLTSGWRYGTAPEEGFSRVRTGENTAELGVSMANVPGVDYQWYPMGGRVSSKKHQFTGYLLDPDAFRGSDNEPLMVGLKKSKGQ